MLTVEKINKMSREEALDTLKKIHSSKVSGKIRTELIEACEERVSRLNIDNAISVAAEVDFE